MEKPVLISDEVNYAWNFLNYPIHTITAKPKEENPNSCAILLIHGFGASTDHWRFNIPVSVSYTHLTLPTTPYV